MLTITQEKSRIVRMRSRYRSAIDILGGIAADENTPISNRWHCLRQSLWLEEVLNEQYAYFYNRD